MSFLSETRRDLFHLDWFKQYLFETISHIQYIIFYGTGFDKKLLAYKHHLLDS